MINREIGNRHGEAGALNYIGAATLSLGETDRALESTTQALRLARQIDDRDVEARSLHSLGVIHAILGDLDRGLSYYEECLTIARQIGNLPGESITLICMADIHADAGRYDEAETQVRAGIEQGVRIDDRRVQAWGLEVLATIRNRIGDHAVAGQLYAQALQIAREIGFFYGEASILIRQSADHRLAGRASDAAASCGKALRLIRATDIRQFEARALIELAHAHLEQGSLEQATTSIERALVLAQQCRQRLIEARARHVGGLVAQAMGDVQAMRRYWYTALEIFTDIGTPERHTVRALLDG